MVSRLKKLLRRRGWRGVLLVELLVAMAIFAMMYQGTMLVLQSALLLTTIAKREQTADFCLRSLKEYFELLAYGSLYIDARTTFSSWRSFNAADSFGVKNFITQVEDPGVSVPGHNGQATCTGVNQANMEWRLQGDRVKWPDWTGCGTPFECYPEGSTPNNCDVEEWLYRIDVRYQTPNMHGIQTYRVVSYHGARRHDCRQSGL